MASLILRLYHYMKKHGLLCFMFFLALSGFLLHQVIRLNYKEDISDFLPLDGTSQNALRVYQNISGANNIFVIFQFKDSTKTDPDIIIDALNTFVAKIEKIDTQQSEMRIISQIDIGEMSEITDFAYKNIPYFLQEEDYLRMDSLLADSGYVERQLQQDKQMLMFPGGGLLTDNISKDPLNLFTPVISQLSRSSNDLNYEMYDGYIFFSDMQKAIIIISSPYGSSETEKNGQLISRLQSCADSTSTEMEEIEIHLTGGPAIAVGNASQIKKDSILSVTIALVIILLILLVTFRNAKNLILIVISIGWGWLFGLGGLSLFHNNVSLIVIGISSVILGIAVNYPLHLIAHLYHSKDMESALHEISSPLIVGNITTVGAFLSLVPLDSIALRDLGIFSSFLLIGTIVFVLIFLPHISKPHERVHIPILEKASSMSLEKKPFVIAVVIILTFVFGYFSFFTEFDSNMSHINYMSDEQKEDMAFFQKNMTKTSTNQNLYVVSSEESLDNALDNSLSLQPILKDLKSKNKILGYSGCSQFLASRKEQEKRLSLWTDFVSRHYERIRKELEETSTKEGFSSDSFDDFHNILSSNFTPQGYDYFKPLSNTIFTSNICIDSLNKRYEIVDIITVKPSELDEVKNTLEIQEKSSDSSYTFDVKSMNSALANALSDNFNYIAWACGLIVFFFLWFSLGSIELALLSFLPMAISWIWILGIMGLMGIDFNIVNVILATFIFGQGDDYTIFMTEGSCYEYAYRKKMLPSYKSSIIISALIMFVGIGSLIVAKHPALHSLAEVTIVGMFSVVLMAYIFPPLIFNLLVKKGDKFRIRPISLPSLLSRGLSSCIYSIQTIMVYIIGKFLFDITKTKEDKKIYYRRLVQRMSKFYLNHLPRIKYEVRNPYNEHFITPAMITCNHQSKFDVIMLFGISNKIIPISNQSIKTNCLTRKILGWLDLYILTGNTREDIKVLQSYTNKGYSLIIISESVHDANPSSLHQINMAGFISNEMHLDIVPIIVHGITDTMIEDKLSLHPGKITVQIYERRTANDYIKNKDFLSNEAYLEDFYKTEYDRLAREIENADYFSSLVLDRYRYKGADVTSIVKRNLSKHKNYAKWIDTPQSSTKAVIIDDGYGEFALLYSLVHSNQEVCMLAKDESMASLVKHCADDITDNLEVVTSLDNSISLDSKDFELFIIAPNENIDKYSQFGPQIVQL